MKREDSRFSSATRTHAGGPRGLTSIAHHVGRTEADLLAGTAQTSFIALTACIANNAIRRGRRSGSCTVCLVRPTNWCAIRANATSSRDSGVAILPLAYPAQAARVLDGSSVTPRVCSLVKGKILGSLSASLPEAARFVANTWTSMQADGIFEPTQRFSFHHQRRYSKGRRFPPDTIRNPRD